MADPSPVHPFSTVVLRHEESDGGHHFDWLIATDAAGELPLAAVRCLRRPDREGWEGMRVHAASEHRPRYLWFEGPLSGDRGIVERVAEGCVERWARGADRWELEVRWSCGKRVEFTIAFAGSTGILHNTGKAAEKGVS
jgi:hypothetical protein